MRSSARPASKWYAGAMMRKIRARRGGRGRSAPVPPGAAAGPGRHGVMAQSGVIKLLLDKASAQMPLPCGLQFRDKYMHERLPGVAGGWYAPDKPLSFEFYGDGIRQAVGDCRVYADGTVRGLRELYDLEFILPASSQLYNR